MICPLCTNTNLQPVVRDGIEIDVCPGCHGMWLDRGELSRLMDADPISTLAAPIPADQYDPTAFGDEGLRSRKVEDEKAGDRTGDGKWDKKDRRGGKEDRRGGKKSKKSKKSKQSKKPKKPKKSKKRKQPSWSRRLGEIIEDVIDELD